MYKPVVTLMHEEQRKSEVKCRIEIVFQALFNGKDCCFDTFLLLLKSLFNKCSLPRNDNQTHNLSIFCVKYKVKF